LVFIAETVYSFNQIKEKNPKIKFLSSVEHNDETFETE